VGVSVCAVLHHSACVRASRRVSAIAPTSSACSCDRNSRVLRSSPSRKHQFGSSGRGLSPWAIGAAPRDIFDPGRRPTVHPGYVLRLSILIAQSRTEYGSALVAMGANRHENAMDKATC
jgi:hypothetical protein